MTTGFVVIVVEIQGWLESQGREDLEKRKETHPMECLEQAGV